MNNKLEPTPMMTPALTNSPPKLLVLHPLNSSPAPSSATPTSAVVLAPTARMILAFTSARKAMQLQVKLPTKLSVEGVLSSCATRAAWMTPQEYVVPTNQKVRALQAKMMTHPYPPSGTWESARREAAMMVSGSVGSKLESSGCV